ncbi:uncharacterized protein ASCRUDRAFT_9256 [Ascoidea rubescens DSM 1968]|uniref:Auxin efflux carrier n=1 Tax=Ascoidea rubescens DSM 1968 TaxID=1344418 RepID=A0A1D2VDP4_9ASCO|nr:hypothetical protein ASCRUDRAFT_9256 [Ascoidea rubescens DSM 1968]ODV59587.1 hypothetical protein ASCRUDRAFT_9256 [Ascoidea rubescens DSM 1968]
MTTTTELTISLSTTIWCSIKPILKIYLIILSGYFLGKKQVLNNNTIKDLSSMIIYFLLPCLIFNKIITNITINELKQITIILLSSLILYTGSLIYGIILNLICFVPSNFFGGFLVVCMFQSVSDFPIAYIQTLADKSDADNNYLIFNEIQADKGIAYICIFMAILTFMMFNFGGYKLIELDFKNNQGKKTTDIEQLDKNSSNNAQKLTITIKVAKTIKHFFFNFLHPVSISLIISFIFALVPYLRGLFVYDPSLNIKNAPDKNPPLNFLVDFSAYVGSSQVPLGLTLLGATLSKLKIKNLDKKFLLTCIIMTIIKLVIMPIIGIAWVKKLVQLNWIMTNTDEKVLAFVIILGFGLPSFTAQVYLTALYSHKIKITQEGQNKIEIESQDGQCNKISTYDIDSNNSFQMDCLAVCLLIEYPVLFISMPSIVTYTLKMVLLL